MFNRMLLVDKETGCTSYDIIRKIKALFRSHSFETKIGHCGTLDPFASGLMIILFGKYTRLQDYLMAEDKTYSGVFCQGISTVTGDRTGPISSECPDLPEEVILRHTENCLHFREQVPPIYSALKHKGKPLYAYAREGKEIVKPARPISVHQFSVERCGDGKRFMFTARVSKGTYIRTLIEDYMKSIGGLGYLEILRRETTGIFKVQDAIPSQNLTFASVMNGAKEIKAEWLGLPTVELGKDDKSKLQKGQHLRWRDLSLNGSPKIGDVVALVEDGRIFALGTSTGESLKTTCFLE